MAFVPIYIVILFATIVVDYFAGILIENETGNRRKLFLTASLFANIGVLAIFKYYNFFIGNFNQLFELAAIPQKLPLLGILLPIGLSFHTFQAMSYTFEVYRGNQKAERHFGIYALYVMFYPQLVAGPIERPQNVLHQFYEKHEFDWTNVEEGLKKMLWGFFKKVVIADRLAVVVDAVYNNSHQQSGPEFVVAALFFTFQIYCDFSGYSDIALGSAQVMGFKLMTNFNKPYFSKSVQEFWRKWHISLSSWFRDYLYVNLGGKTASKLITYRNVFIVFMVSGFWHGANWTFIVWGALHGVLITLGQATKDARIKMAQTICLSKFPKLQDGLMVLRTFVLITLSWILFRAVSLNEAFYIFKTIPTGWGKASVSLILKSLGGGDTVYGLFNVLIGALLICFLMFSESISKNENYPLDIFKKSPLLVRWSAYTFLIVCICLIGVYKNREFIYFQF